MEPKTTIYKLEQKLKEKKNNFKKVRKNFMSIVYIVRLQLQQVYIFPFDTTLTKKIKVREKKKERKITK